MTTADHAGSFRTHWSYLDALTDLAGKSVLTSPTNALSKVATNVRAAPSFADRRPASSDTAQVKASLANAWGTELLLAMIGQVADEDEFQRLANNWAVVQLYYVTYHACQALLVAKGMARPTNHSVTRKQFISLWVNRPLDIPPWTLGAGATGYLNVPVTVTIDERLPVWTSGTGDIAWSVAAKAFRTTREDELTELLSARRNDLHKQRQKNWRDTEDLRLGAGKRPRKKPHIARPNLDAADKARINGSLRAFGLIDYFYRLRIKTNYKDSAMFTDGPEDSQSSGVLYLDLRYLASSTLLLHEMHIGPLIGWSTLHRWMDDWCQKNVPTSLATQVPLGLAARRPLVIP